MLSWILCTLRQGFWTHQWILPVDLWALWNCLPCSVMLSTGGRHVLVYRLKLPGHHSLFWSDRKWKILANKEVSFPSLFSSPCQMFPILPHLPSSSRSSCLSSTFSFLSFSTIIFLCLQLFCLFLSPLLIFIALLLFQFCQSSASIRHYSVQCKNN